MFKKILLAFSIIAFVSCDNDMIRPESSDDSGMMAIPIISEHDGETAKAYYQEIDSFWTYFWENGDKFQYFRYRGESYSGTADGLCRLDGDFAYIDYSVSGMAAGDVIYTFNVQKGKDGNDIVNSNPDKVKMIIPTTQVFNDSHALADAMPFVSKQWAISSNHISEPETISDAMILYMLGSAAEFRIYSPAGTYAGHTITGVRISSSTPCAGYCYYDIDSESNIATGFDELIVESVAAVLQDVPSEKPSDGQIKMIIAPGTYDAAVDIITECEGDRFIHRFVASDLQFNRAVRSIFAVNLESANASHNPYFEEMDIDITNSIKDWTDGNEYEF